MVVILLMEKLFAAGTLEEAWSILRNSSNSSLQSQDGLQWQNVLK